MGIRPRGRGKFALLGPVVQRGPLETINLEQRPEKGEGGSRGVFWWESSPVRENGE